MADPAGRAERTPGPPADPGPVYVELRTELDEVTLAEVCALIDEVTALEGHRPVGEHKYAHLKVGARGWAGALARDEDEHLLGYAHTRWNAPGQRPRVAVEVVVHPEVDADQISPRLLGAVEGLLARAGGGVLWLWVHRVEDPTTTLAARLGFAIQRELAFMRRALTEPPAVPALPAGIELRPYRPDVDDEAFLEVNNAAFAGHPENGDWDRSELLERRRRPWFDPEGLLMAWQGERCLGFHWTKWHGHETDEVPAHEPVGEVYVLGVHPEAQGLGLGRVLLRAGLAHLHERGCREAILYVDYGDEAAVGLYRSEGFELATLDVCYEREVDPAPDGTADDLQRPA